MENVIASQLVRLCQEEVDRGNDRGLRLKMRFCAGREPCAAEVLVGQTPIFDLPVETEPPLPDGTPPSAPNPEAEAVKSNILGWLALARREAARLNCAGRETMCGVAVEAIDRAAKDVRRYVC